MFEYLVGLKYFPFNIVEYADTADPHEKGIRIGTGATLIPDTSPLPTNPYYLTNPIAVIDGGKVTVPYTYKSFLDFEPVSVASIYVPFCGTADIKLSSVTGKTLYLTYYVDLVTGCCNALIEAYSAEGQYPVAQLQGVMGFDMMLTGNNHNQQLSAIMSSLRHTGMAVGGSIASAAIGALSGNKGSAAGGLGSAAQSIGNAYIDMPQTAALHPMTAGSSSSLSALSGYREAFVQITRKLSATPSNFGSTVGYLTNATARIGSLYGYTQVTNPDLSGISATSDEIAMLRDILTSGFYA